MTRQGLFMVTACTLLGALVGCQDDDGQGGSSKLALPAGVTLVESYAGGSGLVPVPYAKYRLANGLSVILHEDHSDPLVHVLVNYHVGSSREEPGRSGFAHFFEHMMFEGSAHVSSKQRDHLIASAGGAANGMTTSDTTQYFETTPSNFLETLLWLESDRMGFLLPAVTEDAFELVRAAVKNERGEKVESQAYGSSAEVIDEHLYPQGHPYSWPTFGWPEDLDRAHVDDLRRFFARWYGPNNATLNIGGDLDAARTLAQVARYFGPLPSGPEATPLQVDPVVLPEDRYVTLEDPNVILPVLIMAIPALDPRHPDNPALNVAVNLLGAGADSPLYKRLVDGGRALNTGAQLSCRVLACELLLVAYPSPGQGETLATMEQALHESIAAFATQPVTDDDLQRYQAQFLSGRVANMESVAGKVSELAYGELLEGDPKTGAQELDRYLAVTPADVMRVTQDYLVDAKAVVLSIVSPGSSAQAAHPANHKAPPRSVANPHAQAPMVAPEIVDDVDRDQQPEAGPAHSVELPPVWHERLENGAPVLGIKNTETPVLTLLAVLDGGSSDEPKGKRGVAALTTALMNEATTEHTTQEFNAALERIGALVQLGGGVQTSLVMQCLQQHAEAAFALFTERLLKPAFLQGDFERVRDQVLSSFDAQGDTPERRARLATVRALYGEDHPYFATPEQLRDELAAVTLQDVEAFYHEQLLPHLVGVVVSNSGPQAEVVASLAPLAQLGTAARSREPLPPMRALAGRTLYLVDKPGAPQANIHVVQPAIPSDFFGDYYKATLANFVLGGDFNSRLVQNLREQKGYTYSIASGFTGDVQFGTFDVVTDVNRDVTGPALSEILGELEHYDADGMTAEEFDFLRNAIGRSGALAFESSLSKLAMVSDILFYRLPDDYRHKQAQLLQDSSREGLNEVTSRLLEPDKLAIFVIADAARTRPALRALGIPIVDVGLDGAIAESSAPTGARE